VPQPNELLTVEEAEAGLGACDVCHKGARRVVVFNDLEGWNTRVCEPCVIRLRLALVTR